MKRQVLATVFALSLLGGGSAFAQDDHHDNQGGGDHHGGAPAGGEHHGGPQGGDHHGGPQGAAAGAAGQHTGPAGTANGAHVTSGPVNPAAVTAAPTGPHTGGPQGDGWRDRNNHNGPAVVGPNVAPQGGPQGNDRNRGATWGNHSAWGGPGAWNRGQNNGQAHQRYDSRLFPHQVAPERRFQWQGHWTPQPGFYYRHWSYGQRLPWGWFGSQWYINDYDYYDLPAPPWGYEWVRVGPDALLVDVRSGIVVESVYGLFY